MRLFGFVIIDFKEGYSPNSDKCLLQEWKAGTIQMATLTNWIGQSCQHNQLEAAFMQVYWMYWSELLQIPHILYKKNNKNSNKAKKKDFKKW